MTRSPKESVKKLDLKSEEDIFKHLGHIIGFGVAMVNLPVALLILTGGELLSFIEKESNLNETRMSDEWLEQVSNTKDVSQEGLAFLAKKLSKQGYISGNDAKEWLKIEEKEAEKKDIKKKINYNKNNKGAVSLLERAKKECGAMVDVDLISNGLNLVSKFVPDGTAKNAFNFGRKIFDK